MRELVSLDSNVVVHPSANSDKVMQGLATRIDTPTLKYVEDKPLDMRLAESYLMESAKANHWSNFGPVSMMIEQEIAERLNLSDDLRVIMCSSGTAAMHAIISLHETLAGRNLRWATSSYGFYSSIQGPLRGAKIVDSDQNAMLDLTQLDPRSVDGFIVTNTFGQANNLDQYYRYAATHGKIVVVDSAMAFGSHRHGANECISFHHTKPWGFGEGGCAIVAAEHEALLRELICFGHVKGSNVINRRANNGKISDIASAFNMMRLTQMDTLNTVYSEQYERIAIMAQRVGFDILGDVKQHPGIPASVPVLAPGPLADFSSSIIPTGRYYYPLAETEVAFQIYNRIVNVPCHAGIAKVSDHELIVALELLVLRSKFQ